MSDWESVDFHSAWAELAGEDCSDQGAFAVDDCLWSVVWGARREGWGLSFASASGVRFTAFESADRSWERVSWDCGV